MEVCLYGCLKFVEAASFVHKAERLIATTMFEGLSNSISTDIKLYFLLLSECASIKKPVAQIVLGKLLPTQSVIV